MARPFDLKKILSPVADVVLKLKARHEKLMEEVDLIEGEIKRLGGRGRGRSKSTDGSTNGASPRRAGKRKRRSREELTALAQEVVNFIRDKGKEGAAAKDLQGHFGPLVPSVNAWLKLYSPVKVKTSGAKAKMRYFA